jgi:putative oxidoreductase
MVRLFLGVPFIIWGIGKLRGGDARIAPLIASSAFPIRNSWH